MKIPIQVRGTRLDKFTKIFFNYLQNDKKFEELVVNVRNRLSLNGDIIGEDDKLDILYKPTKVLRSEIKSIESSHFSVFYVGKPELEKGLNVIIKEYPFLQDWRDGLSHFVCGDRFFVDNDTYPIKLRVRNKKYPYLGRLTDKISDEGVKIVLTSRVSKKELKDWIDEKYILLIYHLRNLPTFSPKSSRKKYFERDRLIVYLRSKNKKWKEIGDELEEIMHEGIGEDTLQKAYEDFPLK